jgi:hypothetical protein
MPRTTNPVNAFKFSIGRQGGSQRLRQSPSRPEVLGRQARGLRRFNHLKARNGTRFMFDALGKI